MGIRVILLIQAIFLVINPVNAGYDEMDLRKAERFLDRGQLLYESSLYDSLLYYFLTAKAIYLDQDKPVQSVDCFLGISDYYRMTGQYTSSEATLDSADAYISEYLGPESESRADALITRAKLLFATSENRLAITLLNQSLDLLNQLGSAPKKKARAAYILGAAYFSMGDLRKAEEYYMDAYITYQQIDEGPTVEKVWLLHNIGLVHNQLGNYQDWKVFTLLGIDNSIKLFGPEYPDLAKSYNSLSGYFIQIGMSDSARYYLEKSEEIQKKASGQDHGDLVPIYIQRARIFRLEGNYYRALDYYQQAQGILQNNKDSTSYEARILYINMGNLYKALGDYASAEKEMFNLLNTKGLVHPGKLAEYYYYMADIQRLLGNFNQSEIYFTKVFNIKDQYLPPDNLSRIDDMLGYGILLDSLRMHSKADDFFIKAINIAKSNYGMHNLKTAVALKSAGDHYYHTGELEKALDTYQQCIFSMDPDYDIYSFVTNPTPEKISNNLFYLNVLKSKAGVLGGMAEINKGPAEKFKLMKGVYAACQSSIKIIDLLRNTYLSDRSKLYLTENERSTYEKCVEAAYLCYELSLDAKYLEQAFMVAEKGKYATLLSVLQREETILLAGIPDSIVEIDARLRMELAVYQELLLESQEDTIFDSLAVEQYQAQIFRIRANIESLNKRLEREFPEYFNLLYNQRVIDPMALRKKLRSSEKLLEYFYGGQYIYRFELSKKRLSCQRIPDGEDFNQELAVIESFLSRNFLLDTQKISHEKFLETAHSLYQRLIPQANVHSRLIIIPEGKLSYFPFDILVKEPVNEFSGLYKEVPFLIRDYSLRYGYSATLMDRLEKSDRTDLSKLIAFAPGYLDTSDLLASAGDIREITIDRTSLRSLPGSISEVVEIGNLSGGRAFTGTTASEDLFKKLAGKSHIIHLATHAFLDDDDPLKSKLVFSEGSVEEDGLLNVYEIYNMDLEARMVVLSACNTGAGILKGGEGIMSLARAFIYAGVPNIVMTLWTVSDKQSYKLMLGFYKQLIAGRSTEEALRRAKLDFLQKADPSYQHPQYWAGYILVGNPDKFAFSWPHKMMLPVLLVAIFLIPLLLFLRRKKGGGRAKYF